MMELNVSTDSGDGAREPDMAHGRLTLTVEALIGGFRYYQHQEFRVEVKGPGTGMRGIDGN